MRRLLATLLLIVTIAGCGQKQEVDSENGAPSSGNSGMNLADQSMTAGCPSPACDALVAQVAAGTKIDSVPADLTPSLQDLKADLRRPDGGQCATLSMPDLKDTQQPCIFLHGRPDAPLLALIGDSQAWAWSTAFDKVANQLGYRFALAYHAGCKLPDLTFPEDFGYTDDHCKQWVKQVVDWVNQQNPVAIIAASAHSSRYGHQEYATGYSNRLKQIEAPNRKLFVMSDVPILFQDATTCLPAHASNALKCAAPIANAVKADDYQATADAAKQADASYINVIPFFCTTQLCPAIVGPNFAAYQDLYHTTSTYAEQLVPVLKQSLGLPPA